MTKRSKFAAQCYVHVARLTVDHLRLITTDTLQATRAAPSLLVASLTRPEAFTDTGGPSAYYVILT